MRVESRGLRLGLLRVVDYEELNCNEHAKIINLLNFFIIE